MTLWLFDIAMDNHHLKKWYVIYKWVMWKIAILNNQRVPIQESNNIIKMLYIYIYLWLVSHTFTKIKLDEPWEERRREYHLQTLWVHERASCWPQKDRTCWTCTVHKREIHLTILAILTIFWALYPWGFLDVVWDFYSNHNPSEIVVVFTNWTWNFTGTTHCIDHH